MINEKLILLRSKQKLFILCTQQRKVCEWKCFDRSTAIELNKKRYFVCESCGTSNVLVSRIHNKNHLIFCLYTCIVMLSCHVPNNFKRSLWLHDATC